MAASPNIRIAVLCVIILSVGEQSKGLNFGLFAGDNKRHTNPLFIKKVSRHAPVFININSGLPRISKPSLPLPKLPSKALRLEEPKLPKIKKPLVRKVPRSLFAPMIPKLPILPPVIPKLPILPIIPPLLPPFLPPLPLLPIPLLPPLLPIPKLPKPLKVPILGKTPLQRALGTELKPVIVPLVSSIAGTVNDKVLEKLLELKRKGSLTTAEYIRFKKLLLKN
ncbi:hypothetical protein O3G_MSEX012622 [Manduca sexta]|uniref:SHOCT domain-containing protein n=1 Tax=Manduca sexta TaxID=7130 RepID=A0A921ZPM9_MANSE|nr:hypothetical protein O3G_MSEX012622 [Manduca sexta]